MTKLTNNNIKNLHFKKDNKRKTHDETLLSNLLKRKHSR